VYSIKEIFYSIQGEGIYTGRPAIFIRFTGCNLWDGKEISRSTAKCSICDTDIYGTDGTNGGKYSNAYDILKLLFNLFNLEDKSPSLPMVVFTGGEPALQVDENLIKCFKKSGFFLAIESNGTKPIASGIDWITLSPKTNNLLIQKCDEVKLLYPYKILSPETIRKRIKASEYYISPLNPCSHGSISVDNLNCAIDFVKQNPDWSLSVQTHKYIGVS
jgi:7-carboxy-7-deazaguanine synthase (Cx14CxxC type)